LKAFLAGDNISSSLATFIETDEGFRGLYMDVWLRI
jgi:hypothetical protein